MERRRLDESGVAAVACFSDFATAARLRLSTRANCALHGAGVSHNLLHAALSAREEEKQVWRAHIRVQYTELCRPCRPPTRPTRLAMRTCSLSPTLTLAEAPSSSSSRHRITRTRITSFSTSTAAATRHSCTRLSSNSNSSSIPDRPGFLHPMPRPTEVGLTLRRARP